jgi:hypothetical protein
MVITKIQTHYPPHGAPCLVVVWWWHISGFFNMVITKSGQGGAGSSDRKREKNYGFFSFGAGFQLVNLLFMRQAGYFYFRW